MGMLVFTSEVALISRLMAMSTKGTDARRDGLVLLVADPCVILTIVADFTLCTRSEYPS